MGGIIELKRLYKSNRDRKLAGVCGGIAEYFNVDPTIIRLIFVFISLAYGTGIITYIICALVIPERPDGNNDYFEV